MMETWRSREKSPLEIKILEMLRERYIATFGDREFEAEEGMGRYFLKNLSDNLIVPMDERHRQEYAAGHGDELKWKMRALHSSSALTFNLFGNEIYNNSRIMFGNYDYYTVAYEKQLPTLRNAKVPAHLDAALVSKTPDWGTAFIEIKMLEWLRDKPSRLRDVYLNGSKEYFFRDSRRGFMQMFQSLCTPYLHKHADRSFYSRFEVFDAFQMAKHALAIYNHVRGMEQKPERVRLINGVWNIEDTSLLEECESDYQRLETQFLNEFEQFHQEAAWILGRVFHEIGVAFTIELFMVQDIIESAHYLDNQQDLLRDRYIF